MENKLPLPVMEINLGKEERFLSVLSGTMLLLDAISGKKSVKEALTGGYMVFRGATGYCPLYQFFATTDDTNKIHVKTSVIVERPRQEVYEFWRQLDNLPVFMKHLRSVIMIDSMTSDWELKVPGNIASVNWTSEIISDVRNEYIAWKSIEGSMIENAGVVQFIDMLEGGTGIYVDISYKAPLGRVGEGLGKLLKPDLELLIKKDIEGLKKYLETGEVPGIETESKQLSALTHQVH
ncbi:MAG: SRPBCC family protein [Bacteroidota bacterium]